MNEKKIQKLIRIQLSGWFKILVPNIFFYNWESDLLGITKDNTTIEFEIKCSRFDYLQDNDNKFEKFEAISSMRDLSAIPNQFFYVVLNNFSNSIEIPEYAGHIIVNHSGLQSSLKIVKKAPLLHKETITPGSWEKISLKIYNRYL